MSDLYLMKKVIILKKMQDFPSIILQLFQFKPEQKKTCGNEIHEKETKHSHTSAADLLHITIGNLDWCAREACHHLAFMGICPTTFYMCLPSLFSR